MEDLTTCPGCGLTLPRDTTLPLAKFNASRGCWKLFCTLSEKTAGVYDDEFIHQMAIDTYEAQHGGGASKNIATAFGLIGLYLALVRNYSGKQVQKAHMILANHAKVWPNLTPPTASWDITVETVLRAPDDKRKEMIREWAMNTWEGWMPEHATIIDLVETRLDPFIPS